MTLNQNVLPVLATKCPAPASGTNTEKIPDKVQEGLLYSESYTYSCLKGYETSDEVCTVCQQDGTWSMINPPICLGTCCRTFFRKPTSI